MTALSLQTVCISEEEAMAKRCDGWYGRILTSGVSGLRKRGRVGIALVAALLMVGATQSADAQEPKSQLTWATAISIAPPRESV